MATGLTEETQERIRCEEVVDADDDYIVLLSGFTLSLTPQQCRELNEHYEVNDG